MTTNPQQEAPARTLTLAEWSAYLPHKIKCIHDGRAKEIIGIGERLAGIWMYCVKDSTGETWAPISSCKLIVRPLSDLNTVEPISGKNYVTLIAEQLEKLSILADGLIRIFSEDYVYTSFTLTDLNKLQSLLAKYYFDMFGLIEPGLAVSIHDINPNQ